jgi:PAS domain S-box-containing protein
MKKSDPAHSAPRTQPIALTKADLIARIESFPCAPSHVLDACPAERLKLELAAHSIELETQNQALRASRQRIEEVRDRYADLYDFAPVGYLALDRKGLIQEINLSGAAMLGCERKNVLGKPLILWLQADSHTVFHQHLDRVYQTSERVVDEMLLRCDSGSSLHVSLVSTAIPHGLAAGHECRSALVDITQLKEKEAELTLSRQQLRNLSAHFDQVREEERRRMAREIHDDLGQRLTTLRFEVSMLSVDMDPPPPGLSRKAASLLKQIDDTIEAVRAIASDLRPAVLDLGLAAAIEWQVKEIHRRTGIASTLNVCEEEIALDDERATAVFRIVQESLTNIIRHAGASYIELSLNQNGDCLHIQVTDNGVGMTTDALHKSRSFGIAGMRERVRLLDGELKISSRPGRGTKLKISIPLKERRKHPSSRRGAEELG